MLSHLLIVIAIVYVCAKPSWRELDNYSFSQYVVDFAMDIVEGSAEWSQRKSLFDAELLRVKSHNAKNLSWKEGVNQFSALTKQEKNAMKGKY